jgi:hypothetical protein
MCVAATRGDYATLIHSSLSSHCAHVTALLLLLFTSPGVA